MTENADGAPRPWKWFGLLLLLVGVGAAAWAVFGPWSASRAWLWWVALAGLAVPYLLGIGYAVTSVVASYDRKERTTKDTALSEFLTRVVRVRVLLLPLPLVIIDVAYFTRQLFGLLWSSVHLLLTIVAGDLKKLEASFNAAARRYRTTRQARDKRVTDLTKWAIAKNDDDRT